MDKVLKFYKLDNGEEKSFPNEVEQIVTSDFTYTAQRMGGAPTITCTVRHSYALDTDEKVDYMLWSDMVYAEFNGEKYYLLRTPTCTYDNTDRRYKYDVEMVSERVILDNVYLFDVAQMVDGERPDAADRYRGVTNSTKIPFYGDINDFATLLNNSLAFSGLYDAKTGKGYHVVVDDGVVSESHSIEFSDQFFSNALQESYNTFEIPYYFVGKAIHIGTAPNDANIGSALSYGSENALLSISKQNANSKLINRITGTGDTRNLPYYYPNETPKGQVDIYVPDSNKVIQTNDIQIDNKSLAYSTTELNNPVVFKKYMPNELTEEISKITYFHDPTGWAPYEEYEIELNWYGDFYPRGIQPYTWIPIAFDTANKGRYTFKYHVYAKFSTTRDEGGLIRWVWNANPRYPLIEEQQGQPSPWTSKGKVGKINYAVFENLKVYEERATGQVSQEASVQGAYPSLYIDTPFQGTPNAKGGRDVILHMEFDMWKHAVDLSVGTDYAPLVNDFNYINFASISLLKTSDVKYVWSAGKAEVEDIKDLGYSLSTRITDILSDASRKDSIVGESFGLKQISYITPSTNLMPSIYRESLGAKRFYPAENNKYELGDGYYHFNNPYVEGKPKEHIEHFDDIYPSIKGMVNKDKVPMDRFIEFAYDEGDNDETNPNNDNELYHPLFYAKLPKLNGDFGFNLFDYASESGAMQITMTSGQCGACTFEIAVDEQTQKNKVQVDENGNLVYDADGKVALGSPQDKQNDTVNNEVWIALRKDINTYPSTMPNVGEHNKPKANEDTFVILNINMPQSYIRAAEKRLDDALIYYMSQHNDEKFNFGIKFSRIYLEEHPEVLSKISENSSVTIDYNNQTPTLYISSFTYRMQPSAILPEITVDLVDKLTVQRNVIENAVSQIKGEILERIASIDFLRQGVRHFVRKDVDDTANGRLRFNKGFESSDDASFGQFKEDTKGAGIYQDESGKWHVEADYLKARNKIIAKSVEIEEAHHIGGQQMLTSASSRIDYVVERENAYRCYFLKRDTSGDTTYNKWMVGDQAYCKYFNVENVPTDNTSGIIQKYYWRLVVATSNETSDDNITLDIDGNTIITSEYHFIDLSKTDCDSQSDIPQSADAIVQLGHQGSDKNRQNAIIMAGAGDGSPYIRQYVGIKSFNLPEADTQIKPNDNVFTGKMVIKSGSTGLSGFNEWEGVEKDINDAKQDAQYAKEQVNLASASIGNLNAEIEGLNESIFDINSRLDGVVESYFEEGEPTLDNYPANEWTTEEEKKNHIGDTYTDVSTTGETAGKSWRWLDPDSEHSGYHWHPIADTDALKALVLAQEAKAAADGKVKTFVGIDTPTPPYNVGDLWVRGEQFPIKYCVTDKDSGIYEEKDWVLADNTQSYADGIKNELKEQIDGAVDTANKAQDDASLALTNSTDAKGLAESANDLADAANELANTANEVASNAFGAVNELDTIAREAKETAEAASNISNEAKSQAEQAQSTANSAKDTADSAKSTLTSWSADNVISPLEKQGVKDEYAWVVNDTNDIQAQVSKYALNDTTQHQAYIAAQEAYTNDLSSVIDSTDDVVAIPEEMATHQATFYATRTAILSLISESAKKIADDAQKAANDAQDAADEAARIADEAKQQANSVEKSVQDAQNMANEAKDAADNAETIASNASNRLNQWADDNYISPTEKRGINDEYTFVATDYEDILFQVERYGLTRHTSYTLFDDAYTVYVADLTTILNDTSEVVKVPIDMEEHQGTYYNCRSAILNDIAVAAKQIADIAKETADAAQTSTNILSTKVDGLDKTVEEINEHLDGVVDNYFGNEVPTTDNFPAKDWDVVDYENHIGDTYTKTDNDIETVSKSWMWMPIDGGYGWQEIYDKNIQIALDKAKDAQDTADKKRRTFVGLVPPTPPYDKGDLWVQGSNGDVLVCKTSKLGGEAYNLDDWDKASKYTDDSKANEVEEQLNNLSTGAGNLIRNSGFTGDYVTSQFKNGTSLSDAFQTYSPSLQHWESKDAIAITGGIAITSESGKAVHLTVPSAYIKQTLTHYVKKGEDYVLSFYAKGAQMKVTFAGVERIFALTQEKQRYVLKLKAINNSNIITFEANVEAVYLCDIMLERGNVLSSWSMSPMDNISAMAEYEKTTYLQQLLKIDTTFNEGDSTLRTGVINTGLIQMGDLDDKGELAETTAGMSGIYNGGDSVAFFGGGAWEEAIATVTKFKDDPNFQPSEEQLKSMAKAVITHGGRAILQDVILRGLVYAEGGKFRGTVEATDGVFNGTVHATDGVFNGVINATGGSFESASNYGAVKLTASTAVGDTDKATIMRITSPKEFPNGQPSNTYYTSFKVVQSVSGIDKKTGESTHIWYSSDGHHQIYVNPVYVTCWSSTQNPDYPDDPLMTERYETHLTSHGLQCMYDDVQHVFISPYQIQLNVRDISLQNLPTSSKGLGIGQLYNDNGTLKIKIK